MNIRLKTIPHSEQRYPTVGDWEWYPDGSLEIRVSDMGNDKYALLVAIHELCEQALCKDRGITEDQVNAFDIQFEKDREAGKHTPEEEPGDHKDAPYRKEHFFATNIERQLALEFGVDWKEYDKTVVSL